MFKISHTAIILVLLGNVCYAMPLGAYPRAIATGNNQDNQLRLADPPLPPSGTPVGRRRGAAGRGNCTINLPLTALVPQMEKSVGALKATYVWGTTIASHPTFWFYLPDSNSSLQSVEFVLQDEQNNDIYRTPVSLPQKPGVVSVQLPSTLKPLNINQSYHWFLKTTVATSCDRQQPVITRDDVEGWVQRVSPTPTLTSQLKTALPDQQIALYAQNGLWYDALTALAQLRQMNPQDKTLRGDWQELLHSVGLSEIADQSLVQCCTPAQ